MAWSNQGPVRLGLLFLLTFFFTDARECKINCHGSVGNILHFEPGKVYNYKLDGQSVTTVTGSQGEASKLGITADVQISVVSGCEHVLKVTNVQTSGQDGKKHNLDKVSQQPIKFGIQNGLIESELCANDAEDSIALNIKRAVLSMFQSSVLKENGYGTQSETDVFGTCPTGFEFSKSGGTITVVKNRDLNKCVHREELTLPFLSTPYYVKSDIQTSPLLASSLRSEQKIEGGILKSAYIEENYQYRPGGSAETTSKVLVKTHLTFANSASGVIPAACTVPRSIIFEQEHSPEGQHVSNKIVDLVRQGCESRIIGQDTAQKFSHLIRTVAAASKADINAAIQHVKSGPGIKDRVSAQRMLMDAVLMAQSGSSVEIMADILKKKEVTGNTARMWLLGLGAVKHASRSSLLAVLPLLDGEPDVNAFLGIGSLAGKYCREHACDGVNEVNQLQIKLGAPVLRGCKVGSKQEEDHIIASLKGLGNIKYLGPKIAGKIIECAQDESVRTRIRVAALETIATDPNKEQFKTLALNILKNVAEDSELRIKSYLILAKCPCGKVAGAIKDLLSTEQSNQVGGYIVSHLRNLHASTNPDKAAAQHHLGAIIPPHRFIIDPRRYSINQELSYSNGIINSGASGEVDIIYSQNSYAPRSVSLNLTTQIFGTAFNFLELDLRADNIERYAERMFGPYGIFNHYDVEEIIDDGKQGFSHVLEKIASRYDKAFRPKRSISRDQLDNIARKVHLPPSNDDADLDFSMKVLGSEVLWLNLHGSDIAQLDTDQAIDETFGKIEDMIHAIKNSDVDYRRHFTFMDREVTYPTGMGLALRLKSLGTAALRIKLDGKIDLPAIIKDPKNADIRFQLIPSAAINIGGEIVVDGVACETGIRMDLNIHTSTGSDVTFRLLDGHGIDVKLGLPLPKQEIISVKTEFTSIVRGDNQALATTPIKYDTPRANYEGCFDQLNTVLGLTFCGDISAPYEQGKPIFPLYGPVSMSLRIEKEDESLSAYHFRTYYNKNEENVHAFEVLLDTPNSKTSRKLSLNLEGSMAYPNKYISAAVESPWTSASLKAHVVQNAQENSVNVKFVYDGQEYSARLGSKSIESGGGKVKFEPIFEYKSPEPTKSALIGKKGSAKSKSQAIATSGSVTVENTGNQLRYVFHGLGITTPRTKYSIDGTIVIEKTSVSGDLKVSYDKEHVFIKGKAHYDNTNALGNLEISPTQYPDLGISASVELYRDPTGKNSQKLVIVHGPDPKSQVSRIYIHQSFDTDPAKVFQPLKIGPTALKTFSTVFEITYPVVQLDVSAKLALGEKELSGGFRGKLDKYSTKLEGGLLLNGKHDGEYLASVDSELMGNEFKLQSSRSIEGPEKSRFTNLIIFKPGGTYKVNALVNHRFVSTDDADFSIEADGSIPNKSAIKLSAALKRTGAQCHSKLKFHLGDKCFIDSSVDFTRGDTPTGVFKFSLPGYIESDGKLTSDGSHTNVNAQVFLPKADRKMEAKADFVAKSPKYSGDISICYDTKDPHKTIKIKTDNDVSLNEGSFSLDTKNALLHGDNSLNINGKAKSKGTSTNFASNIELEVVLPNGYHLGTKYNDKLNLESAKEGESHLVLWDKPKGGEEQKLEFGIVGKHIDLNAGTVDGQASLSYTTRDKKDIHAHVNAKKLPSSSGKSSSIVLEVGSSGSLVDLPVAFKLESDVSNEYFEFDDSLSIEDDLPPLSFKVSGSAGQEIKIDGTGKIGKPSTLELSGKLPQSSPVKNFKLSSSSLVDIGDDDSKENSKAKFINSLHWNDNKFVKVLLEGQREDNGIQYAAEYETDGIPKRRLSGSAHYSVDDSIKGDSSIALTLSPNNVIDVSVKGEVNKEKTDNNFHVSFDAPAIIDGGKVDFVLRNKVVRDGRGLHSELVGSQGGQKKLTANAKVELDRDHPLIEVNLDRPQGKSRLFYKYDKKGDRHYASELKIKWTGGNGGSLAMESDVNLESVDNFFMKGTIDSPELFEPPRKIYVEVVNKPAKGEAKKITFLMKGDDKVIASGSSNYNFKEEGDVAVLEGNGNIKYKDQSYPLNFQATRQLLENGRVNKLMVKAGKMSLNVENKVTPEEFLLERTFCKEPKACSKAQVSSKIRSSLEKDEQSVNVILDLSLFNPKLHDISYKSEYKRHNLLLDHNVEFQWAKDAKLKSSAFVHDSAAGLYVEFPKRTVGGEVKYISQKKDNSASWRVEGELHLNKGKEPKLSVVAGTTTLYDKGAITVGGEFKVAHPSLQKDLVAKGQLAMSDKSSRFMEGLMEIDVSPDANNKLIGKLKVTGSKENLHTLATLKSKGCNIDVTYEEKIKFVLDGKDSNVYYGESLSYVDSKNTKREFAYKFEASSKKVFFQVKAPEGLLEGDFRTEKGYVGSLNMFGKKYRNTLNYNKDTNTVKYQLTGLSDGKSLTAEAGGKIGGAGVLKAAINDKEACSLDVNLDEANFLKSKYSYDTETLKNIYATLSNEAKILVRDGSKTISSIYDRQVGEAKRLLECLNKGKPNLGAFVNYYEGQLKHIIEEVANDETLKEAAHLLKEASGKVGDVLEVVVKEIVKLSKTICQMADEAAETLKSILNEIQPKIKSSIQKLSKAFSDLIEQYLKLSEQLVELALDELKKHQEDIEVFAKTFADFAQDVGKQIGQLVVAITQQLDKLIEQNVDSLKDIPVIAAVQEKLQELKELQLPVELINLLHEVLGSFKQLLPTNEATQFVTTLESVLEKVLAHEDIPNKDEVMKQLYKEFIAAVKSLLALVAQNIPQSGVLKPTRLQAFPLFNFLRIPTGTIRFSLVNLLSSKEFLPSIHEILSGFKISLNPLENIPPYKGHGYLIGGTEVITFDGVHISIPASCSYILAEDYKDRNFSIVGQIANGAVKSLTISSRKDSVELRPNANALVNGKEHVIPIIAGALQVWRNPITVGVWSDDGVLVMCSSSLESCYFGVNGFYFGRVRGLLGNMNGEQYDDRLLPEGKIVPNTADLANAWKLDGSCSIPSTSDHKHNRISECTKLFTDEPIALFCRPFVNPAPFRDACDHLSARSKLEGACKVAQAYTAACRHQGVLIAELPDMCASCKINGKSVEAGESEEVAQGSVADIILLVEQTKDNEENYNQIAVPLEAQLRSEFAKAGVSDVRTVLIGASPLTPWPAFFTNQKGEVAFDPATNAISFYERPVDRNETLIDRLRTVYKFISSEIGRSSGKKLYETVTDTPFIFRPNSFRLVVGVHGKPCSPTLGTLVAGIQGLIEQEIQGIQYSVISPIKKVKKNGEEVSNACIIDQDEAILTGGENVKGIDLSSTDICVIAAIEENGVALSSDALKASSQRPTLLKSAATRMVGKATEFKKIYECECSLWKGVVPHPDCYLMK